MDRILSDGAGWSSESISKEDRRPRAGEGGVVYSKEDKAGSYVRTSSVKARASSCAIIVFALGAGHILFLKPRDNVCPFCRKLGNKRYTGYI